MTINLLLVGCVDILAECGFSKLLVPVSFLTKVRVSISVYLRFKLHIKNFLKVFKSDLPAVPTSSPPHSDVPSLLRPPNLPSAGPSGTLMSQFSLFLSFFLSLLSFLSLCVFFYLANRFSFGFFQRFFLMVAERSPSVWSGAWCG